MFPGRGCVWLVEWVSLDNLLVKSAELLSEECRKQGTDVSRSIDSLQGSVHSVF